MSLVAAGTVEQVQSQVRHATQQGEDASQLQAVRELILSELDNWPESDRRGYDAGVLVELNGYRDARGAHLRLEIRPLFLPKPGSDEPPEEHEGRRGDE